MSIKRNGRRVTVTHNRAMAARIQAAATAEGKNRGLAYYRLATRGTVCRVVGRSGPNVLLAIRGSDSRRPFVVPVSACKTVQSKPKETK